MANWLTEEDITNIFDSPEEREAVPENIRAPIEPRGIRLARQLQDTYGRSGRNEEPNPVEENPEYTGKYIDMQSGKQVGAPDFNYLEKIVGDMTGNRRPMGYDNSDIVYIEPEYIPDEDLPDPSQIGGDIIDNILNGQEDTAQPSSEVSSVPRETSDVQPFESPITRAANTFRSAAEYKAPTAGAVDERIRQLENPEDDVLDEIMSQTNPSALDLSVVGDLQELENLTGSVLSGDFELPETPSAIAKAAEGTGLEGVLAGVGALTMAHPAGRKAMLKSMPKVADTVTRKLTGGLTGVQPKMDIMPVEPKFGKEAYQIGYERDPRFDVLGAGGEPRKQGRERLRDLTVETDTPYIEQPKVSIADFEGKPFITSMADRTRALTGLQGLNDVQFERPVDLQGGQDYMFNETGNLWASDKNPSNAMTRLAEIVQSKTGETPLYMPWRMGGTGGDHAMMTGETMLAYNGAKMNKKNKAKLNREIKKNFIKDWKGIEDPASIEQFRKLGSNKRKAMQSMLDTKFRNEGGLSLGEARLAIADPTQLLAREGGVQNVGKFDLSRQAGDTGHNTYNTGVAGEGIGRLEEDFGIHSLLPNELRNADGSIRVVEDPLHPTAADIRSLQMKPFGGIITEEMIRNIKG